MNAATHQIITDSQGNKTGVIVPTKEYEEMLATIERYQLLYEFEAGLKRSFAEVRDIKDGKQSRRSFQSLIDEL